ncbi:MAG TPA: hypothetical protein VKU41_27100 [Polyangiaceae bacterium]|nr:hypothetical protein [Polyangiaceae bacterium]
MTIALVPCRGCARHVKRTDERCPFCGARVEPGRTARIARVAGKSRAALFAAGAGTLLGTTDCGSSTSTPGDGGPSAEAGSMSPTGEGGGSGSSSGSGSGSSSGSASGSVSGSSSSGEPMDASPDVPMAIALYGAAIIPDAGTPDATERDGGGASLDAAHDAPSAVPLYGAVPIKP